jgi:hypothetical protein
MNSLKTLTESVKSFFKNGAFGALNNNKSKFTSDDYDYAYDDYTDLETAYMLSNMFIIVLFIVSMIMGFIAVNNICRDSTARGKNTRLGLYLLMVLSGGSIAWVYVLLWILKIDICS